MDTRTSTDKVRENRLRRMAARQGLRLSKSRTRDTRAVDYGTYMLSDPRLSNAVLVGGLSWARGYGASLDEIESYLLGDKPE